jgi:hypothetical protein
MLLPVLLVTPLQESRGVLTLARLRFFVLKRILRWSVDTGVRI